MKYRLVLNFCWKKLHFLKYGLLETLHLDIGMIYNNSYMKELKILDNDHNRVKGIYKVNNRKIKLHI